MPASLTSHPSAGKEDGEECIFKGETCQKSGDFHQREAPEGRRSIFAGEAAGCTQKLGQVSEAWFTSALPFPPARTARVDENHPISGRTPRYLCTSGNWGSARQITRPLPHSSGAFAEASGDGPHLAYRSAYGNRSSGACPVARRGGSRLMPHSHPCLSCIRYDKTRHTGMLTKPVPNHRDLDEASACARAPLR